MTMPGFMGIIQKAKNRTNHFLLVVPVLNHLTFTFGYDLSVSSATVERFFEFPQRGPKERNTIIKIDGNVTQYLIH